VIRLRDGLQPVSGAINVSVNSQDGTTTQAKLKSLSNQVFSHFHTEMTPALFQRVKSYVDQTILYFRDRKKKNKQTKIDQFVNKK
jgi:hypothetical protein